jgi:O-antigen/teichoic acid export membrane protein
VVAFAPQIMALWIDGRFAQQSSRVLQILAVGAFITGLAWIPLALLHGVRRPDLSAKIHLVDLPLYSLALWLVIRRFGLSGAAFAWSGRMLLENLALFAMASRFIEVSARVVTGACAAFALAIALVAAGGFIGNLYLKTIFVLAVLMLTGVAASRFLLQGSEVTSQLIGWLPAVFGPAYEKSTD